LNPNQIDRTKSAFDDSAFSSANWWIIPKVKARWNEKITGSAEIEYEDFLMTNVLKDSKDLTMLSIGSGVCSHEIKLAQYSQFKQILCIDIADNLLTKARVEAENLSLQNIDFLAGDIYKIPLEKYDIVFFHASLHHFKDIENFIAKRIIPHLNPRGFLIMNEYVGPDRLQYPSNQIKGINKALHLIPISYRTRFKSDLVKQSYSGSGKLRMIIADPSECVDSSSILPVLHKYFDIVYEKPYGGNILMSTLKDIAHHFVDPDDEKENVLNKLFEYEDEFLKSNQSDFYFGVYRLASQQ